MGHPLIWVLAWFASARLTRLVNADVLTEPLRNAWERHWAARTQATQLTHNVAWQEWNAAEKTAAPDERRTASLRKTERKAFWKFERARVMQWFVSCPWCIGFWIFLGVTFLAWYAAGAPWVVLGGPWWFTLPAFALGGNWVYALVAGAVDGDDDE